MIHVKKVDFTKLSNKQHNISWSSKDVKIWDS